MENKSYYKRLFPLLIDYYLYDNSESCDYNCISYTINELKDVSWPIDGGENYWPVKRELTKESFDLFYEYHGFIKCSMDFSYDPKYTKVALFTNNNIPTHASIQIDYDWWESKIGSLGIIKHDLFEIEDITYGKVTQIYKKSKNIKEGILSFSDFINNI